MSISRDYFIKTLARDVMTRDVVTCSANESSAVAVKLLKTNKISGAPVVSNEGICLGGVQRQGSSAWRRAVRKCRVLPHDLAGNHCI